MSLKLFISFNLVWATGAWGLPMCFTDHLTEAIDLNEKRAAQYSKLTDGESDKLSQRLILLERMAVPFAKKLDTRAHANAALKGYYCEALVPIDETPAFSGKGPVVAGSPYPLLPIRSLQLVLGPLIISGQYDTTKRLAERWLQILSSRPSYHCLVRHVLESLVRSIEVAQKYLKAARLKEQRSLGLIIDLRAFLESHLLLLNQFHRLDQKAAKFQKQGIPFLCSDVPIIR